MMRRIIGSIIIGQAKHMTKFVTESADTAHAASRIAPQLGGAGVVVNYFIVELRICV